MKAVEMAAPATNRSDDITGVIRRINLDSTPAASLKHPSKLREWTLWRCFFLQATNAVSGGKKFTRARHFYFNFRLVALLVSVLWSPCLARTDKTPLLLTNDDDGFRYFMRPTGEDPNDSLRGRALASSLVYTPNTLAFQAFKRIEKWGNDSDILLVSGKNHVYMLETKLINNHADISYRERLTWRTPSRSRNECIMMPGQPVELCENFIRFVELLENGELMVCGTNSYSPACRYYTRDQFDEPKFNEESHYQREAKCRGQCVVPYNPITASAALYTNTDNGYQIFAAVINDFMSNDPIIMRKDKPTLLSNSLWLNDPTFIKIMEHGDKVYVFFREIARQSESRTLDQVVYARVARICKNDPGGVNVLAQQWTSFLKARLRCGYSNEQHLEFNNLTSVSDIVTVTHMPEGHSDIIFASFTTPWQWADASLSAICAFSLKDISKVFDEGRFFGEYEVELKPLSRQMISTQDRSSEQAAIKKLINSYPIEADEVPTPRPGGCGLAQSPNVLYFAKEHPLMYDDIQPIFGSPVYVTHNNLRATEVAIDNNAGGSGQLMIYLGTEDGKVLRLRGMLQNKLLRAVLIESITVGEKTKCEEKACSIRSLHVSRPIVRGIDLKPSIFVGFTDYMAQLPLSRCHAYKNKECCSIDPDCGWNVNTCVVRTSYNSMTLSPTSKDTDPLPGTCNVTPTGFIGSKQKCTCDTSTPANCGGKTLVPGTLEPLEIQTILDMLGTESGARTNSLNLKDILGDSVSLSLQRQFSDTVAAMREGEQRMALKKQLEEAVSSTVDLVLKNHKQEYCLPSAAVNHLTHVYPLLLRQIELWHDVALKKMNESAFDNKCWSNDKNKCTERVSFSLPLDPMLWEPLTKLIINFSGDCNVFPPGGRRQAASFRPKPRSQCASLPGLEMCTDPRQPHCAAKRCLFEKYNVDVKAFFRHANDSRHFLKHGGHIEPLWKAVNITIPNGESIKGHLELTVSERAPFIIDYSPVAEKVKIRFRYSPVRDCALTDPMCIGAVHGCDPEVESIIDHWFKWIMRKMSPRMRKCLNEIIKAKKGKSRKQYGRRGLRPMGTSTGGDDWTLDEGRSNWNIIPLTPNRCKRVVGKVRPLASHPFTNTIWQLMVTRCRKAGGIYSVSRQAVEFHSLQEVLHFFKNTCTFEEAAAKRRTFRKRSSRGRSKASVYIEPMVTPDAPFIIQRYDSSNKVVMKYFTKEV